MNNKFKKICTEEEVAKANEYVQRISEGCEKLTFEEAAEVIRLQAKCAVDEHLKIVSRIFDRANLTVDSPRAVIEVTQQMSEGLEHDPCSKIRVYAALAYLVIEKLREQQTIAVAEEAENA